MKVSTCLWSKRVEREAIIMFCPHVGTVEKKWGVCSKAKSYNLFYVCVFRMCVCHLINMYC